MRFYNIRTLFILGLLALLTNCHNKKAENSNVSRIKVRLLKARSTLKSNKDLLLGLPIRLKYDDKTNHLFIQDEAEQKIIEIDDSSNIVNTFGGKGRGPGELQNVENFFITPKDLFIVDAGQFLINKYSRRDGRYISSLNYGKYLVKKINTSKNIPPSAPSVPFMDNNNKPFVTAKGTILLPTQTNGRYQYEEISWSGKKLANIGKIPNAHTKNTTNQKYWKTLEKKKIPARELTETFLFNDSNNPNNFYLVYSAMSKIAKYNLSGRKIWERKIPHTPEVDSLTTALAIRAKVVMNHPDVDVSPIPVRKYMTGKCSTDGDLYLTTYTDPTMPRKYHRPLWIHQFGPRGKFIKRYKIISNADVSYYPGVDFKRHLIYVSSVDHRSIQIYHY